MTTTDTLPPLLAYAERQAVATARQYKKAGTSAEAAAAAEPKSAYWRQKVREALAIKPMAPHDIAAFYNVDVTTIRPRCSELLNTLGEIEPCGRARTPAGRTADIYRLKPKPVEHFPIQNDPTGGAI